MPKIKLGEFLPDQERINNPGLMSAINAKPVREGYLPLKGTSNFSTNTTDGDGRIIQTFTSTEGVTFIFAGDATKLYKLESTLNFVDIKHAAGVYTKGDWKAEIFGNRVMMVNGPTHQVVQSYVMGTDTVFTDIANSPKAGSIALVKNVFTFLGDITEDATSPNDAGVHIPHRVRWSASNDPTLYYPSAPLLAASLAGFQDLNNAGKIQNIAGGAQPVILGENRIFRATFEGGQTIFRFDPIQEDHGCLEGSTMISFLGSVYYLSKDGWFQLDSANQLNPIGNGKIDRFFFDDLDNLNINRISTHIDASEQLLMWAYPGPGNTAGNPNRVLIYNYAIGKWAILHIEVNCLGTISTPGYTLEQLDTFGTLDGGLQGSLDSDFYKGGEISCGAIVNKNAANFGGAILTASFITGDLELDDNALTFINKIFPIVDTAKENISLQVGAVNNSQDTPMFGLPLIIGKFGDFPVKSKGRFHRLKLDVSGEWTSAKAMDVKFSKLGSR